MARNKAWKGAADKRDSGAFRQVPLSVLEGRAYLDCSPYAVKLLFDLLTQYRGQNNGDLTTAWKIMKPRGWRSEMTLHKAKRELLDAGLIVETRMGARPNKCSLYALTFFDLDENDKLEMTKRSFPRGAHKLKDPTVLVAKATESQQLGRIVKSALLATRRGVSNPPTTPSAVAMRALSGDCLATGAVVLLRVAICAHWRGCSTVYQSMQTAQ